MSTRNITPEEMEKPIRNMTTKNNSSFDAKNYLNVRLDKGQNEKSIKIRLLTVDKDTNSPFKHIHMHTVKVPPEVSENGWKSYVCLSKTHGDFTDKLGTKCPFCERKKKIYEDALKAKDEGDANTYDRLKKESSALFPNEVGIIRCIERGHEDDGPKFWKFNIRADGMDPENQIRTLYKNRRDECKEEGLDPENILDLDEGRDLKVTIKRVFDKEGRPTKKTTVSISVFGSQKPITDNEELKDKWIDDPKVWSDVFVAKPYEYMQLIIEGKIPWFDRNEGKWVEKRDIKKDKESEDREAEEAEKSANTGINIDMPKFDDDDEDSLPF